MPSGPVLTLEAFDTQSAEQTDTELIAVQAGKRIAVYQLYVSCDTAATIVFESGATTVWTQFVPAGGGSVLPYTGVPWFATPRGGDLTYTTGAAVGIAIGVKAAAV